MSDKITEILKEFREKYTKPRYLLPDVEAFLSQALRQAHEDGYNECRQFFETEKNILIADMEKK